MLAPLYVEYLAKMVGTTLVKHAMLNKWDGNDDQRMLLAALLLNADEEGHQAVLERLQDYGDNIVSLWHVFKDAVKEKNENEIKSVFVEIDELFTRHKPGF